MSNVGNNEDDPVTEYRERVKGIQNTLSSLEDQFNKLQAQLLLAKLDQNHCKQMIKKAMKYSQEALIKALNSNGSGMNDDEIKRLAKRSQMARLLSSSWPKAPTKVQWMQIFDEPPPLSDIKQHTLVQTALFYDIHFRLL
jgi:hypothetical protein